jgi:(S)-ureidoglycine aminohydrolase
MSHPLGSTRTVIKPNYALISPDSRVTSVLPGWTNCVASVQISTAMGANLTQLIVDVPKNGAATSSTGADQIFFFVVSGGITLNGRKLGAEHFAFLPPGTTFELRGDLKQSLLLIFQKRYEILPGQPTPAPIYGDSAKIKATAFLGDPNARLQTLLPDTLAFDMAINVFTYDPGATLPFVESHLMEHGMLFLSGAGIYRLGADWYPVQTGDAIWIAPYCEQWFVAMGKTQARYIYYKDVNRSPK